MLRAASASDVDAPGGSRPVTLEDIAASLRGLAAAQQEQGERLKDQGGSLERLTAMVQAQGSVQEEQGATQKEQGARLKEQGVRLERLTAMMQAQSARLGEVNERLARGDVRSMFGQSYAQPLLARSLQDMALLWPTGAAGTAAAKLPKQKLPPADEPLRRGLMLATAFSTVLVDAAIPRKLLLNLRSQVLVSGQC